jgi:predicted acyl esterase
VEKVCPVPVDIGIRPMGMRWHKGEKLQLIIAGYNVLSRFRQGPLGGMKLLGPVTRNKGYHIIHTGDGYNSYLLMPKVM